MSWQRIALTLMTIDLVPMTHHVECVALLTSESVSGTVPDRGSTT